MPTKDPVKNQEYVAKSRGKLRASIGDEAYKKQEAEARQLRRLKAKAQANLTNTNSKVVATRIASNFVGDVFNNILSTIPQKRRGRPRKDTPISTDHLTYKERRRIYMRNYMRTYRK